MTLTFTFMLPSQSKIFACESEKVEKHKETANVQIDAVDFKNLLFASTLYTLSLTTNTNFDL